ncbi:hypothetical protein ACMBCN_02785, partial [Candidatus Liberibacter asiaticus]|nr:hypothetical protein [Candidatus Liberibacter asiaticus]
LFYLSLSFLITHWGQFIISDRINESVFGRTPFFYQTLQGAHPSSRNFKPSSSSSSQSASHSTPSTSLPVPPPQSLELVSLTTKVDALIH